MKRLLISFKTLYLRYLPEAANDPDDENHWKEKILYHFLLVSIFLGFIIGVFSYPVVSQEGYRFIAFTALSGYLVALTTFLFPELDFKIRAGAICIGVYLIGVSIIVTVGPFLASREWLFAFSIFSSVFLGWFGALFSVFLNTLTYVMIGYFLHIKLWEKKFLVVLPEVHWFQVAIDLFFLNVGIVVFVTFLFKKIEGSNLEIKLRQKQLKERQIKLKEAKITLENEVERRKKIQERFQKTQEMMIQNEKMLSIGGLAAGMAHEINNPLAGMMQNAQLAQQRFRKDLPENLKVARQMGVSLSGVEKYMSSRGIIHLLENINMAGIRAAKIVENMLSFARKTDSLKRPVSLPELLDNTIGLAANDYNLKTKYDFRKIQITRQYDATVPMVICEDSKIQQVIFNLLKNASDALASDTDKNKIPEIIARLYLDKAQVCIEIEDNGPGMQEEVKKRIFEPFFTTKEVGLGTGLGLSVSYFIIVDAHKGEFMVQSHPGIGTRFVIKLPLN